MSDFSRSGRLALSASCPSIDCGCFVLSSPSIYVKLRSNILLCLEIQLTPLYCTMVTADVCASVSFILHKSGQHFQVRVVFPTDHIQLPDHLSNVLLGWSVRVKWSVKENIIIALRGKRDIWTKIFDVSLIPSHHRDQSSSCRFSLLRRAWGPLVTTFTDLLPPVGWSWMYPKPSWCHSASCSISLLLKCSEQSVRREKYFINSF